ncbi:MAG: NAD-binding protein, partial [Dongiaceae bacterium]
MVGQSFTGGQAVVVGAGTSGLGAAAALANHFEQVTVLERGELPATAIPRSGTPQDKHLQGLLTGGLRAFGALLPGFAEDLHRAGATPMRVGADVRYEYPGCDPMPQPDHDWTLYSLSRPLLEVTLRRRIAQKANVTFRQNCRVLEILRQGDEHAAGGVRYETAEGKR